MQHTEDRAYSVRLRLQYAKKQAFDKPAFHLIFQKRCACFGRMQALNDNIADIDFVFIILGDNVRNVYNPVPQDLQSIRCNPVGFPHPSLIGHGNLVCVFSM